MVITRVMQFTYINIINHEKKVDPYTYYKGGWKTLQAYVTSFIISNILWEGLANIRVRDILPTIFTRDDIPVDIIVHDHEQVKCYFAFYVSKMEIVNLSWMRDYNNSSLHILQSYSIKWSLEANFFILVFIVGIWDKLSCLVFYHACFQAFVEIRCVHISI